MKTWGQVIPVNLALTAVGVRVGSIPWAYLLQGLPVLPRPLGQVLRPVVHQDTPALEQARATIGCLHQVPDHMLQGCLEHVQRVVRLPTNSFKVFSVLYLYRVERLTVSP